MVPGQRMNDAIDTLEGFGRGPSGRGNINLDLFLNFSDRPAR